MQTYTTPGSACEGDLPPSWHTNGAPVTPEFIAGTFVAQPRLSTYDADLLKREGIPLKALHTPIPVRTGRVVFAGNSFEIEPYNCTSAESEPAYLFLVTDRQGKAQGVIAWAPETERLAASHHLAWALGQDTGYRPRLTEHQGLRVWRSPWSWLRAGREGIVPVRKSALPFQLDCAGPIIVEDTAYGDELRSMLAPPLPRILVAVAAERRTA